MLNRVREWVDLKFIINIDGIGYGRAERGAIGSRRLRGICEKKVRDTS